MLRYVTCPRCSKKLRVDDASGLRAGKCPACTQKFRMPWAVAPASAPPPQSPPAAPRPSAVVARPAVPPREAIQAAPPSAAPPVRLPPVPPVPPPEPAAAPAPIQWEEQYPVSSYSIQLGNEPPPGPENLLEAQILDDDEDERDSDGPAPGRKRKKKKKRRPSGPSMSLEMSNFLITLGVMGVLWVILSLWVFFKPSSAIIVLLIGGGICSIGQTWFIRMAFEDGVENGLMCMFVPLYPWLYLLGNLERAGKPFAIRMCGLLIIVSALIMFFFGGGRNASLEDHPHHDFHSAPNRPGMDDFDRDD
jgi:hypothetical protein